MKTQRINSSIRTWLLAGLASASTLVQASTDYPPAVWRPTCDGEWYTTGYGKKFYVIHDMEGYYLTGIAYLNRCDTPVSVHYAVNGKKDNSSDAAPGEVSQCVRDSYYAWHARCWNQHSMGTEHEGFASNPAWFTPEMYDASTLLTESKADKYSFAKDRNHICGHDQKRISGWPAYASANLGIDPYCNDHTDPGLNWDWTGYMNRINAINPPYLFGSSGDIQSWTGSSGMGPLQWTSCCGWPGVLYVDQIGDDGYLRSPSTFFTGAANSVLNVSFYAQSTNGNPVSSHDMKAYWKTTVDNTWDEAKSTPMVTYDAFNEWVVLNLDVNDSAWTSKKVNQLRLDFDAVSANYRWILNHVLIQTVPRWFYGASVEGWTTGTGMSAITWNGSSWPGIMWADQTGNDGRFYSPAINFRGAWNDVVHVRVYPQNGTSANHDMQLFWTTSTDATWTASKSSPIAYYTAQNAWADVYLNPSSNTNWSGYTGQVITQLRLDVDNVSSATRFLVDSVSIEQATSVAP